MKLLTAAAAITTCLLMSGNVMAQNIQIKVDGKAYAGGLNGNDAAKDFAAKLPLKLKFEDFGSTERISYLPKSLNLGSASRSCDPQKGDITSLLSKIICSLTLASTFTVNPGPRKLKVINKPLLIK